MAIYAITGAAGRLGRLVIEELLSKVAPSQIVALTRNPSKCEDMSARGVTVRAFDFDIEATLIPAFAGVERLLLISGSAVGRREKQHRAAIVAAKRAGVNFIAYTSVLHADTCPLGLASEHRATEADLKSSGLHYALLRHGWYTENTTANAATEMGRGTVRGSAGHGRQSTAARADYAAADAAVLLDSSVVNQIFELAGDTGYTLGEYAAELSSVGGTPVAYIDIPEEDYKFILQEDGLPEPVASLLASASALCARDIMLDEECTMSKLIGRPTTTLRTSIIQALSQSGSSSLRVFQQNEV